MIPPAQKTEQQNSSDEESSSSEEQLREETIAAAPSGFVCPLTLEVMLDPVVSRYGQSYEREAIMEWLAAGNDTCPMTRQPLRMSGLISNQQLRMKIRRWQLDNGLDINLVGDASNEDFEVDRRIVIYFTLPEMDEDAAERSRDDPNVIQETRQQRARTNADHRGVNRSVSSGHGRRAGASETLPPSRILKRPGLFGRLLSRRAVVTA